MFLRLDFRQIGFSVCTVSSIALFTLISLLSDLRLPSSVLVESARGIFAGSGSLEVR